MVWFVPRTNRINDHRFRLSDSVLRHKRTVAPNELTAFDFLVALPVMAAKLNGGKRRIDRSGSPTPVILCTNP